MKPRILFFLLLLPFLNACQPGGKPRALHWRLDSLFASTPEFNGVALVADSGNIVYRKAFGFLNYELRTRLDTTSIFELASVSKQFTTMCIMILHEEGKLEYDDLLEKYIPGLPYPGITIRHLMTQTSGLPDYQAIMDEHWDKTKVAGNPEIIEYLKQYHPPSDFPPGKKYEYSNTGYVLLGTIVEKASGKDFVEFCRERIFFPVKMMWTAIRTLEQKSVLPDLALGHIYVPEKKRYVRADSFPSSNYNTWLGNRKGPGRVSSTVTDLLKWDRALYTERLVKQETLREAFTPVQLGNDSTSNYGFGWMLRSHPKLGKVVFHTGDNPGYSTIIIRYIDVDKTVILLCNNATDKFTGVHTAIEKFLASRDKK